jgi:hypothetical protein
VLFRGRDALGSLIALGLTLGASRTARADVRVERAADAASCPDTASFADRMRDGAGNETTAATSQITVRFERTTSGFRSWVSTANGKQRSLGDDAPNCDGLAEATVLAVRLALELDAPPAAAPAGVRAPEIAEGQPAVSAARRPAPFAEISASGVVIFGLASPLASGMRAGAALVIGQGSWSLGVTGLVLPSQTRTVGQGNVDVSVLGGGMEGCGRLPIGSSLLLALCARAEALTVDGNAHGFARAEDHARPVFTGTLLGRARAGIVGPVALFVEGGAVVPFARERFSIDTVGVVYDPPAVAAATGIGILVDFQ